MDVGRRERRLPGFLTTTTAAAVAAFGGTAMAAPSSCELSPLSAPDGHASYATGMSRSGAYVTGYAYSATPLDPSVATSPL